MNEFSPKKYKALACLASGMSAVETAETTRVSRTTIQKWQKEPNFKQALKQACVDLFDMNMAKVTLNLETAITELNNIIADEEVSARVKVSACLGLIGIAAKVRDWNTEARLERLEGLLDGSDTDED